MSKKPAAIQADSPISDGRRPRLHFLSSFMSTIGDSGADVARSVGKTRACVSNWFKSDNTRLSYCYQYISSKGYDLEISLEDAEPIYQDDGVSIIIEKKTKEPGENDSVRLAFLRDAMIRRGIKKSAMADMLGVEPNTVRNWFLVDDVYVSHIFTIAEAFGLKLCVKIKPKD